MERTVAVVLIGANGDNPKTLEDTNSNAIRGKRT